MMTIITMKKNETILLISTITVVLIITVITTFEILSTIVNTHRFRDYGHDFGEARRTHALSLKVIEAIKLNKQDIVSELDKKIMSLETINHDN